MGNDTSCVALALKAWKTQIDRADRRCSHARVIEREASEQSSRSAMTEK